MDDNDHDNKMNIITHGCCDMYTYIVSFDWGKSCISNRILNICANVLNDKKLNNKQKRRKIKYTRKRINYTKQKEHSYLW